MGLQLSRAPVAHVRFQARSLDVPLTQLRLGATAGDADVRRAVARVLDVPEGRLNDYVIDRHENGNLTVRPEAVFG
jgi:hypothetical protein